MISSGRGPTNIPMTGGSATGDFSKVWDALANDPALQQRLIALGRGHPGLTRVLDQVAGRSGPPRDVQTGRFLPRNIAPAATGGISVTQTQTYYRDFHQFTQEFHRVVTTNRIVSNQPYGPFAPGGPFGPYRPAQQYGPYPPSGQYGPYRPMGGPTVPPSGPSPTPFGPWGPRIPPGGGGAGGGGGGGFRGGGFGGGAAGAVGLRHYGLLRGFLVGEIASQVGGELIKDVINPSRLIGEIYQGLASAGAPFLKPAFGYYGLATTGGFSGQNFMRRFARPEGTTTVPGQPWMEQYAVTNEEILKNFSAFGLGVRNEDEGVRIARGLAVGRRLPGFAHLDPSIPLGLAGQAGALGIETPEGASDQYLRKLADYGFKWTKEGADAAQVFKNMSGSLDIIAKSGVTGIDAGSVQRIFDRMVASGLPGGRTGALAAQMIGGETQALNTLGSNPVLDSLTLMGLQKAGGMNETGLKNFLGQDVIQAIGGEGSKLYQDMLQAIRNSDFKGLSALIGVAQRTVAGAGVGAAAKTLGQYGVPPAMSGVIQRDQFGRPLADTMGYGGLGTPGMWSPAVGHASQIAKNDLKNNWGSIGGRPSVSRSYLTPESGVQAVRDLLLSPTYMGGGINTLQSIISKWAPPNDNDTAALISRASNLMGISPTTPIDPNDPEMMRRLVTTMILNEHGGVYPKTLSQGMINSALGFGGSGINDLVKYARGNALPGGASPITGINPAYADRIAAMVAAMPPEIRSKFGIESGFRSAARQAQVNPGVKNSRHTGLGMEGTGLAVDIVRNLDVINWIRQYGGEFGVGFPFPDDPKEINHMEPFENGRRVVNMKDWIAEHKATNGRGEGSDTGGGIGSQYAANPEGLMSRDSIKFTTGEGGVQIPEGAGKIVRGETADIGTAATWLEKLSSGADGAAKAVDELGKAASRAVGLLNKLAIPPGALTGGAPDPAAHGKSSQ